LLVSSHWAFLHPEVAQRYNVEVVPFVAIFKGDQLVASVSGAHVSKIRSKLDEIFGESSAIPETSASSLEERMRALLNQKPIMLLMKGTPEAPQCGFSRQIVAILAEEGIKPGDYGTFNILSDEEIRQGVKAYSNFPTFPQLYVKGELIGGLDICKELKASGELKDVLIGS